MVVIPRVARRGRALAALALATAYLSGCGAVQDDAVRRAALDLYEAHAAGDGAAACTTLAPRTRRELVQSAAAPCPRAVLDEDLPDVDEPARVQVFGTQAQVAWRGETTFLARFREGWKVVAAACTARPRHPYDCQVSGG